jgi:hypothetical protein
VRRGQPILCPFFSTETTNLLHARPSLEPATVSPPPPQNSKPAPTPKPPPPNPKNHPPKTAPTAPQLPRRVPARDRVQRRRHTPLHARRIHLRGRAARRHGGAGRGGAEGQGRRAGQAASARARQDARRLSRAPAHPPHVAARTYTHTYKHTHTHTYTPLTSPRPPNPKGRLPRFYYIHTGRQPDPATSVYDALLFFQPTAPEWAPYSGWDVLALAVSPLRAAWGRLYACVPQLVR